MSKPVFAVPTGDPEALLAVADQLKAIEVERGRDSQQFNGTVYFRTWQSAAGDQARLAAGWIAKGALAAGTSIWSLQEALRQWAHTLSEAQAWVKNLQGYADFTESEFLRVSRGLPPGHNTEALAEAEANYRKLTAEYDALRLQTFAKAKELVSYLNSLELGERPLVGSEWGEEGAISQRGRGAMGNHDAFSA